MRVTLPASVLPSVLTAKQTSPVTFPAASSNSLARVCTSSFAPLSSAAGIVVTSIDCLALVGQPMPQEPRFQQPFTLRLMTAAWIPSLAAPRRSKSLFSFGAVSQGVMFRRRSAASNHGASASTLSSGRLKRCCQTRSVAGGVRNELVQFTVVEPPTHRPCRMLIALSLVLRAALSW
jgi:hypothetical protein